MPIKPSQALTRVSSLFKSLSGSHDSDDSDESDRDRRAPIAAEKLGQQHLQRIIIDALATIDSQCFEDLPREVRAKG